MFRKFWPYIILVLVIAMFFSRLFFPRLGTFVTPDFGQSDLLHGYYPIKYVISQSFSLREIPLWTKLEANGYPLLADGQIGYFSLYNLLLFGLFSFPVALNLLFILLFSTAAIGTYLYSIELGFSKLVALFVSLTYALSGYHIAQISHISLLHAISFFPLEMYCVEKLLKRKSLTTLLVFSLILSQQILSGHQQMTLYALIALYSYVVLRSLCNGGRFQVIRNNLIKLTLLFVVAVATSILLSAIQLLPSIELFNNSVLLSGKSTIDLFPYPLRHVLSFINPFFFGSPQNATYQAFSADWGIFWENTAYVGIIPLIFLPFFFILRKKYSKYKYVFISLLLFSLLLVLGKYSPLYFIYEFPPLSSFRVASRFLFLTAFSLTVMAGFVLQEIKQRFVIWILLFLQICLLFYYFFSYHPVLPAGFVFNKPNILEKLKLNTSQERIFTLSDSNRWNNIFLTEGWMDPAKYVSFMSNLHLHTNLYQGIPKANPEVKFVTKRKDILNNFMNLTTTNISSESGRLLGLQSVRYIISPIDKPISDWRKIETTELYGIYENPYFVQRARMVYEYVPISTVQDITNYILSKDSYKRTVLTEKKLTVPFSTCNDSCEYSVRWVKDNNNELIISVTSKYPGIFVVADSYYPGWNAQVDGKNVNIIPVNIDQRGIILEKGTHTIRFSYMPKSFLIGLIVTIISHLVLIFILWRTYLKDVKGK